MPLNLLLNLTLAAVKVLLVLLLAMTIVLSLRRFS
jgi:hypothetical protein